MNQESRSIITMRGMIMNIPINQPSVYYLFPPGEKLDEAMKLYPYEKTHNYGPWGGIPPFGLWSCDG